MNLNQLIYKKKTLLRHRLEKHQKLHKLSTSLYLKYCSATGSFHILPDFYIIGFVKCGTTSLYEYLMQHPCVHPPKGKEISYFDRLYFKGINWYKVGFPLKFYKHVHKNILGKEFQTGEATPQYIEHPYALYRLKKITPNAKFIVLLRNPIDRSFSQYNMNMKNDYEYRTFADALKHESERIKGRYEKMETDEKYYSWDYEIYGYLEHGIYANKLKHWMKVFPKDQFLILQSEEFLRNTSAVFQQVQEFLKLPKWELDEYVLFKKREYKEKMDPDLRRQLAEYFRPHNEQLYALIGRKFDWDE